MNAIEIAEYRAETARIRAAEEGRTDRDAASVASHDRAVRAALQVLRDADHDTALVEVRRAWLLQVGSDMVTPEYVAQTAHMLLASAIRVGAADRTAEIIGYDHDAALVEHRRVMAGRRLDRACELCSDDQRANHSNRDHGAAVAQSVAEALAASKR